MKILAIISLFFLAALAGCASPPPSPSDPGMQQVAADEKSLVDGCREWVVNRDKDKDTQYNSLTAGDKTFALMHRETMDMISSVWGKSDPCKPGTNQWDVWIAYYENHKEESVAITQGIVKLGTAGVLTWGGVEVVKNAKGETTNVSGDGNSDIGNSDSITQIQASGTTTGDNTSGQSTAAEAVEEETEWTEDDPGCSVESRAEGKC